MQLPILVMEWDSIYFRVAILVIMMMNLFALFIKLECVIEADYITFKIYLFQMKIYERHADKTSIKQVIFKRAGWKTKSAVIKMHQGYPIRLISFVPDTLSEELAAFCKANAVSYFKTKDFLILEKLS